jgi:hypothetical protein
MERVIANSVTLGETGLIIRTNPRERPVPWIGGSQYVESGARLGTWENRTYPVCRVPSGRAHIAYGTRTRSTGSSELAVSLPPIRRRLSSKKNRTP